METKNYKVNRKNIYVGEVVRTSSIYRQDKGEPLYTKHGNLYLRNWASYRSMLFVPNEEKLANDLLYQSPNYPILNISDDETCLTPEEKIVIAGACNLDALLKYFGYSEELNYEDIMRIRKTFFTGRFAMDHCGLFGWKESRPEDFRYFENGIEVTDPKELKKKIAQKRKEQETGHRTFSGISKGVLSREYWYILDDRGDQTLKRAIGHKKRNAFSPHKQEGPIKKLVNY